MISSTANPRVKRVRALQARKRTRWQERAFVVEGRRMAQEVLAAGTPVEWVMHASELDAEARSLVNNLARLGGERLEVSAAVLQACSDTESVQDILMVLPMPAVPLPEDMDLALVLDHVADPGNLGTILRTALAVGVQAVFLTPGSVDVYNPKVVRAAMGAHLRLPVCELAEEQILSRVRGMTLWRAEAGQGQSLYAVDWTGPVALVIGSEAHGPGDFWRTAVQEAAHIPMPGKFDSLNAAVATAVMLFEILRQRRTL